MFHRRQYAMAMGVFLQCARITRASPRALPGISTFLSFFMSRPTRGGIGDGEFDVDLGGGGVRELAKWRRVQEMARRRAQTGMGT